MLISPNEKTVQQIRDLFTSNFTAPSSSNKVAEDVWRALEGSIFKEHIFASSFLAIIDHSNMSYRHVSPSAKDFTGFEADELMEKGLNFFMSSCQNVAELLPIYEKITALVMALPVEHRMHMHLFYDYRIKTPNRMASLYQQTIPLAFNDQGYPYLMLAVVSDTTEFKTDQSVHYKATLNLPGQPIKILLSGSSHQSTALLTTREKEIVHHLGEGLDANAIAQKLFISEGTVRTHRKNILEKTGAKNSVHLVRMAVANGWM